MIRSLCAVSSVDAWPISWLSSPPVGIGPRVHTHSRLRLRRPATGVSGHESLSLSDDESRLSPILGERILSSGRPGRKDKRTAEGGGENRDAWVNAVEGSDGAEGAAQESSIDSCAERTSAIENVVVMVSSGDADLITAASIDTISSDSISECFQTCLVVLISSSSGLRNDTCFSVGKIGRLWLTEYL